MKRLIFLILALLIAGSTMAAQKVQVMTNGTIDIDKLPTIDFSYETDPAPPVDGQIWWNETTKQLKVADVLGIYEFNATALVAWDTTPTAFSFTDVVNATTNSTYTSAPITVAGINHSAAISVSGDATAKYSINNATAVATNGTVDAGDEVRAVVTSSASSSTAVNATVTIGGVSDAYSVTTANTGGSISGMPDDFSTNTLSNYVQLNTSLPVVYDATNDRIKMQSGDDAGGVYYDTSVSGKYYVQGRIYNTGTQSLNFGLITNCNGNGSSSSGYAFIPGPSSVLVHKFTGGYKYGTRVTVGTYSYSGGKTWSGSSSLVARVETDGDDMTVKIDFNNDGDFADADETVKTVTDTSYSGGYGGVGSYASDDGWVDDFDIGGM